MQRYGEKNIGDVEAVHVKRTRNSRQNSARGGPRRMWSVTMISFHNLWPRWFAQTAHVQRNARRAALHDRSNKEMSDSRARSQQAQIHDHHVTVLVTVTVSILECASVLTFGNERLKT